MIDYRFYHPIEVRYGDLDPQGHVNNAKYLTYFEHARTFYLIYLGLFEIGQDFLDIGIIMADVKLSFHAPVQWENQIKVGVRFTRIGNKSMIVQQEIVDHENGTRYASGEIVLVAYDYHKGETISVPDRWRKIINEFEDLEDG
jgi:acyl-CoA thioester hydrolase